MAKKLSLMWGMALVPALVASPAVAAVLWDNGPLVTHPGGGFGGADASRLLNTMFAENILGYGHQTTAGNAVADDFTIGGPGWHIDSITFFAYQTNGPINGSVVVSADILNAFPVGLPAGVYSGGPGSFSNIYRDTETSVGASNRAIQAITVAVNGNFAAGNYWLSWQAVGNEPSGPWAPPVSYPNAVNGLNPLGQAPNGQQYTTSTLVWSPVQDSGSFTPDEFPFIINGSVIPAPGALALLLVAAGGLRRRRR